MKPFGLKYAIPCPEYDDGQIPQMEYDVDKELMMCIKTPTKKMVIEEPRMAVATGTYMTRADRDPTRDESADR